VPQNVPQTATVGSYYGATATCGVAGEGPPTADDLAVAEAQGLRVAEVAQQLLKGKVIQGRQNGYQSLTQDKLRLIHNRCPERRQAQRTDRQHGDPGLFGAANDFCMLEQKQPYSRISQKEWGVFGLRAGAGHTTGFHWEPWIQVGQRRG